MFKIFLADIKDRHCFVWDSSMMMLSGGLAGALFFIFHAVMKRMLGDVDYASLVSLLGLLNVMGLPMTAIAFTMTRFVAEHAEANAVVVWTTIFKRALRKMSVVAGGGLLIWIIFSDWLADFFGAPSVASIVILGMIAAGGLLMPIIVGVLQGAQDFKHLALITIISPLLRLIMCIGAVLIGARVAGVMGAIAVSFALTMVLAIAPFKTVLSETDPIDGYDTSRIYKYMLPIFLSQGALLILTNADIIFFKRFLYGEYLEIAPGFAQAATLSRAVIFIAQPLAMAMFPRAVSSRRRVLFWGPLIVAAVASLALGLFITINPALPFRLMYANHDPACHAIARRYVWAAMPLSLTWIVLKYVWARDNIRGAMQLIPVVALYLIVLYFNHTTPNRIIASLAIGSSLALAVLLRAVFCKSKAHELDGDSEAE